MTWTGVWQSCVLHGCEVIQSHQHCCQDYQIWRTEPTVPKMAEPSPSRLTNLQAIYSTHGTLWLLTATGPVWVQRCSKDPTVETQPGANRQLLVDLHPTVLAKSTRQVQMSDRGETAHSGSDGFNSRPTTPMNTLASGQGGQHPLWSGWTHPVSNHQG